MKANAIKLGLSLAALMLQALADAAHRAASAGR